MSQIYSQKYTIVCFFLENHKTEFPATDWPLHVTMLDTFKTDWSLDELYCAINDKALATKPFETLVTKTTMLGENKDVTVKLLQLGGGLLDLHAELLSLADEGRFIFNTPEYIGDGFLPHATDQKNSEVVIGRKYLLNNMSLVDMFPDGNHLHRKILNNFAFSR